MNSTDRRRIRKKKARSYARHAQQRVFQRYGLWLNEQEVYDLSRKVARRDYLAHVPLSKSSMLVLVEIKGKRILGIYRKSQKLIVTFLPPDGGDAKRHEFRHLLEEV